MVANQPAVSCNGCDTPHDACIAQDGVGVRDIEDMELELSNLQNRMKDLSAQISARRDDKIPSTSRKLRSRHWFGREDDPPMSALYIERYLNYGLTRSELQSGKPIIGIAQSGSDIAPCNRHHMELSKRVREGIRTAGGIAFEFNTVQIQETSRRPTATLDRNLSYLTLVETLHAYPFDGVVLLTGCDKTTPAALMAAATLDIPAICLNVGPMLNGYQGKKLIGSGTIVWEARELHGAGKIDQVELVDMVSSGTPSAGHCNTMGTASTMNALAEALGMSLPGNAAIPAPYRERAQCAYETGLEIVSMVHSDRKPSDIMTRKAFENAIAANTAIGGSTNAPIHLNAIAKHVGIEPELTNDDWEAVGYDVPLLVNMQPAGQFLGEDYHRAGGLPTVMAELHAQGKIHGDALTANGKTWAENIERAKKPDNEVILSFKKPMKAEAGFLNLKGNIFDSAIMKTSVINEAFREAFLRNPKDMNAFEGKIAVFDGPEDYHKTIDKRDIDERTILIMRGTGPLGYPGKLSLVHFAFRRNSVNQQAHSPWHPYTTNISKRPLTNTTLVQPQAQQK